jgi:hypothetical protein
MSIHLPRIEPVRVRTEEISRELLHPGSMSGNVFPFPRTVFLDELITVQDLPYFTNEHQQQQWEYEIGRLVAATGAASFLDQQVFDGQLNSPEVIRGAKAELGTYLTAEFYDEVFSQLFDEEVRIMSIATGVQQFNGYEYHEMTCLPAATYAAMVG